jgi:hypothetical protein
MHTGTVDLLYLHNTNYIFTAFFENWDCYAEFSFSLCSSSSSPQPHFLHNHSLYILHLATQSHLHQRLGH